MVKSSKPSKSIKFLKFNLKSDPKPLKKEVIQKKTKFKYQWSRLVIQNTFKNSRTIDHSLLLCQEISSRKLLRLILLNNKGSCFKSLTSYSDYNLSIAFQPLTKAKKTNHCQKLN